MCLKLFLEIISLSVFEKQQNWWIRQIWKTLVWCAAMTKSVPMQTTVDINSTPYTTIRSFTHSFNACFAKRPCHEAILNSIYAAAKANWSCKPCTGCKSALISFNNEFDKKKLSFQTIPIFSSGVMVTSKIVSRAQKIVRLS